METQKEIFISYAWGNAADGKEDREAIVNELDEALIKRGIKITRDKRDLGFKGEITKFMEQIGTGKAVIIVLSDKYLKSPYCMFELLEIYRNLSFKERIFPIVLPDANIFDPLKRLAYLKYWKDKKQELDDAIRDFGTDAITVIGDDYKLYKKIFDQFGEISNVLKDINSLTPDMHRNNNFEEIISGLERILEQKGGTPTSSNGQVKTETAPENNLESIKKRFNDMIDDLMLDDFFKELPKTQGISYVKSTFAQLRNEFTGGTSKYDPNFAPRLKTFINSLKTEQ